LYDAFATLSPLSNFLAGKGTAPSFTSDLS